MTNDLRVAARRHYKSITDAITAGSMNSTGIDKRGFAALGVLLPTITSGSVGFAVSGDGTTYVQLDDPPGTALNLGTTSGCCALSGSAFEQLAPWPYARLTFGAAASTRTATWYVQG